MGACLTSQNFESCSAASKFSRTMGAMILTETPFCLHFSTRDACFQYSIRPFEDVIVMISSLADCSVSSYFFSAAFASAIICVFGVGLPVSISIIFLPMSVPFCHNSSKTAVNACTSALQFVQRQTSSFSGVGAACLGVMKKRVSSSSLITI